MAKHRILVTGASGFVGRWVCAELEKRVATGISIEVLALGRDLRKVDLRDEPAVVLAVQEFSPTAVIHLAAVAAPREAAANARRAWEVNVIGTLGLTQAVLAHAPSARFIHVGSSEAYGSSFNAVDEPITETAELAPITAYGATKAASEIVVSQMARQGLQSIRFRPFNHTGPGQGVDYVVPAFARQLVAIEKGWQAPTLSVGNLEAVRDFLDVRDVCRAYVDAALRCEITSSPCDAVFNLATGQPISIRHILEALIDLSGVEVSVAVDAARVRPNDVPVASGDACRALAEFQWRPQIPLDTTLRDVISWFRAIS